MSNLERRFLLVVLMILIVGLIWSMLHVSAHADSYVVYRPNQAT